MWYPLTESLPQYSLCRAPQRWNTCQIYPVTATKQQCSKITKHKPGCYTMDMHNNTVRWFMSPQQWTWNRTPISWLFIPVFSMWPSFSIQGSKTWKSRQLWQNQVSLTITWTQQSDQNCFTGNRQTNITNACELNYCSTWLVLNQLLPRKLTQSFSPAGEKCALTAVLSPWSQTKNKTLLHIPTMSFQCLSEFMFLFYSIPHSLLYVQEEFFFLQFDIDKLCCERIENVKLLYVTPCCMLALCYLHCHLLVLFG